MADPDDMRLLWDLQYDLGRGRDDRFPFRIRNPKTCGRLAAALARVLARVPSQPHGESQ